MPTKPRTLAQYKAAQRGESVRAESDRTYDRFTRDPAIRAVYGSAAWQRARKAKLSRDPLCEICEKAGRTTPAAQVHHVEKLSTRPDLATTQSNLMSVCVSCHARVERGEK